MSKCESTFDQEAKNYKWRVGFEPLHFASQNAPGANKLESSGRIIGDQKEPDSAMNCAMILPDKRQ